MTDEPKPRRRRVPVLQIVLVTALLGTLFSHVVTTLQLRRVTEELTQARKLLVELDTDGPSRLYAATLPTFGPSQWRWRMQLPPGLYAMRHAFRDIPPDGFPDRRPDQVFLTVEPGEERFVFVAALHQDRDGRWRCTLGRERTPTTLYADDLPESLRSGSGAGFGWSQAGADGTESVAGDKPLLLLRYRKSMTVAGGVTVNAAPTEGVMVWLERTGDLP